jgi:hypothetical protein
MFVACFLLHNMTTTFQLKYPFSEHIDKLNWGWLSRNPNAIHLLEQNVDKVNWHIVFQSKCTSYLRKKFG